MMLCCIFILPTVAWRMHYVEDTFSPHHFPKSNSKDIVFSSSTFPSYHKEINSASFRPDQATFSDILE